MGLESPAELVLRLGEAAAGITCEDEQDAQALRKYFRHCAERVAGAAPQVRYHVTHPSVVRWGISRNGELLREATYKQELAETLMQDVTASLIDGNTRLAALHAAGVARGGRALLIPAGSGRGKSTLAAWLVAHGWGYLTDELTLFEAQSGAVWGLARPLVLKQGSAELGRGWFAPGALTDFPMRAVWIDPGAAVEQAQAAWLVFPNFQPGQAFQAQALSPAEAIFELLQTLVNARHLPGNGMAAMRALAQRAPAYRLTYGALDGDAAEWLDALAPALRNP